MMMISLFLKGQLWNEGLDFFGSPSESSLEDKAVLQAVFF